MMGPTDIIMIGRKFSEIKPLWFNYVQQKGLKFAVKVKWTRPEKKPMYLPSNTGDLSAMPTIDKSRLTLEFQNSEAIKTAKDEVRKIFTLENQSSKHMLRFYENELTSLVKRHPNDNSSLEYKIAKLTAWIRYFEPVTHKLPINRVVSSKLAENVNIRKKFLTKLRELDYRKFEWVLEKLDLKYTPYVEGDLTVTRKKSLTLLVKLKVEQEKEKKLAQLREDFDKQKVPFLEKKLEKLKWIKEMEHKYNLTPSVTDSDIEECAKRIERVKVEVSERQKIGYIKKIHPYTLEKYDDVLLREKENS